MFREDVSGGWNTHAVTWLLHTQKRKKNTRAPQMHAHSQPQRALVLTGSRPPLLSDRQDVWSTFISPRLWFLCRHSCLFSALLLHSALLLKYVSPPPPWWRLSFHLDWETRRRGGGVWKGEHAPALTPPPTLFINRSSIFRILPTFIPPSFPLSRTSWFTFHHPSVLLPFFQFHSSAGSQGFLLSRRRDLVWVTDSWARIHEVTSASRCWGRLSSSTWPQPSTVLWPECIYPPARARCLWTRSVDNGRSTILPR